MIFQRIGKHAMHMNRNTIRQRLLEDNEIKLRLQESKAALEHYKSERSKVDHLIHPKAALQDINRLMGKAETAAQLDALCAMRAETLAAIADKGEGVSERAKVIARKAYGPTKEAISKLAERAVFILEQILAEAVASETEFFKQHGLPVEATSVRKIPTGVLAEFKHWHSAQPNAGGSFAVSGLVLPHWQSDVVDWFN